MDDADDTQEPGSDQDQGKQSHLALSSMTRRQQQTPAKTPIATKTNKQRNTTPPFETHAARAIRKTNKRKRKERHEREKSKQQSTGKWRFTHGSLFFFIANSPYKIQYVPIITFACRQFSLLFGLGTCIERY